MATMAEMNFHLPNVVPERQELVANFMVDQLRGASHRPKQHPQHQTTPMRTDPVISVSLPRETWSFINDLLKEKQASFERDIDRVDDIGGADYAQVLIDCADQCKQASDEICLAHSLASFDLPKDKR
jgi:hypothetical protein